MRFFKAYFFLSIGLLLSCSSEDKTGNTDFFTVNPTNLTLNLDAEATNNYFTVKSDRSIQVGSDSPDWCKPTLSNVSIDNLKIAISENQSFQDRRAIVTVSNGLESKSITINQKGMQADISVDKNSVVIQFGKQEFTLEITSNIRFDLELPEWIREKEDNAWQKGRKKYTFLLTALPDDLLYRDGLVIIKPKGESATTNHVSVSVTQRAITKIIAHRGYWLVPEYPQNSLASLQRAVDLGVYGSELDVWITKDGALVLNHDATIGGINVENSNYADLKDIKLSNGEPIPTLQDCIELIKKGGRTKLIIEIKPHSSAANENRAVTAVLDLVKNSGVVDKVDYISFSQNICNGLIAANPQNRVAYLNGNLSPEALNADGYWGLDYSSAILKANTGWVQSARSLGLTTNVWTVNSNADFDYFITMGVDFITTDQPQLLKELLSSK